MRNYKSIFIGLITSLLLSIQVFATPPGEGMWIPMLLEGMNETEMQAMGMKMTAEDIYSVNNSSLKDAVASIGGCTAEVISDQGLLLTNHHCGFGQIRRHSTVEKDYLKNGFWAMSLDEELASPGMKATFIIRIEDVTEKVLKEITDETSEEDRQKLIARRTQEIIREATKDTHYQGRVRPFYEGNEYYLFITEVFTDVRLVGAPPSSIGKFGGETDNWVWPRHTGDFSIFRIYSGPDGKPAPYSEENIPFKPRRSFNISLKGVEKGDFTMVYGFPGRTEQYLPSYAVDMIMKVQDPVRIKLRGLRLDVMKREMQKSDKVNLQYASKEKSISNGYKKWQGELRGLKRNNSLEKKREFEAEFKKLVKGNGELNDVYSEILDQYEALYAELTPVWFNMLYFMEGGEQIEVVDVAYKMAESTSDITSTSTQEDIDKVIESLRKYGKRFFKDYNQTIDRDIMVSILNAYKEDVKEADMPAIFATIESQFQGNFEAYADYVYANTNFADEQRYNALLDNFAIEKVQADPAFGLMAGFYRTYYQYIPKYQEIRKELNKLDRKYMKAIREAFPMNTFLTDEK